MELHDTVGLVIRKGEKILLVKRATKPYVGFWTIPGGHVEHGETIEEAAIREAREEVGEIKLGKLITVWIHDVDIMHRHRAHFFFAELLSDVKLNEEASEYRWLSIEEMKGLELTDYTLFIINHLIEHGLATTPTKF